MDLTLLCVYVIENSNNMFNLYFALFFLSYSVSLFSVKYTFSYSDCILAKICLYILFFSFKTRYHGNCFGFALFEYKYWHNVWFLLILFGPNKNAHIYEINNNKKLYCDTRNIMIQ